MFYLVTGQRRGQRREKGILKVVCEEDMHVDYVPVIQSSAFKPGGGSFQTVQSRTWSQGFEWIFPHNAVVAVILQSIHALGTWRNKILGLDLLSKWLAYVTRLKLGRKLNSSYCGQQALKLAKNYSNSRKFCILDAKKYTTAVGGGGD